MAYHGVVESNLRYGIIFWGNSTQKEMVFKTQKRCIRAMFKLKTTDSCRSYFINSKIMTLPCLYIFEAAVFVKTNPKLFKKLSDTVSRNRRDRDVLCIRESHTTLMHKSIFCMGPVIYNKIPKEIKELNAILFKRRLKDLLLRKCYYDILDFINEKKIKLKTCHCYLNST